MRRNIVYNAPVRLDTSITLDGTAQGLSSGSSIRYEGATVQAIGGDVRYTLDGSTSPVSGSIGMVLFDGEKLSLMNPSLVDQAEFINQGEVPVTLHIQYH